MEIFGQKRQTTTKDEAGKEATWMENLDFEFSEVVKNLNGKFKMTALDEDIVILADDIIGFTSDYSVA